MLKRVLLFMATNILVMATISIIINLLGLHGYISSHGINYTQLLAFCLIWGMAGSFISLFLSKFMAKMAMGVVVINPNNATREERFLVEIVYQLAQKAGLRTMPEVGIYHSPEINAFATGPSANNSLVAVSSGLLVNLNRDEIEAVLGHEIAHVANGDMVTMTLVQGVVNSFSMFLSRTIAYAISIGLSRDDEKSGEFSYFTYTALTILFDICFTVLGTMLVAAYSRWREYRADAGGAHLAGRYNMIAALRKLQRTLEVTDERAPSMAALKISQRPSWLELFSTHPPMERRIAKLEAMR